jgi:hypothetical protein
VILAIHILIMTTSAISLVLLCRLAIELRRESKREPGVRLPTGMTIEKELDKTIYKFHYDD